jgi:predicted GNAT family acetyltransferase
MDMNPNNDPIQDWVNQPIPEKLWHYTSVQGFQGIIASGNIYATDVRFLNDTEEFIHARKVADEVVEKSPEFGSYNFPLHESLEWLVNTIFKSDFLNRNSAQIFVASFTDSEDDLSQWRGYSHGTCGVSIAFGLGMHRLPIGSDSAVTFAPCVYDDDKKQSLIQYALQHFINESETWWADSARRFLNQHSSSKTNPDISQITEFTNAALNGQEYQAHLKKGLDKARKSVYPLCGLLKHRSFHHEREWRFVLPISPNKDKTNLLHPIRFRSTNTSLVPYIEFPLGLVSIPQSPGASPTLLLPVNDVLLGPGASDDAANAALDFLKSKSIKIIPRRSDVPYRQV